MNGPPVKKPSVERGEGPEKEDFDEVGAAPVAPIEGVDYTIENGLYVFTAKYHLERGHCCHSGCRHCPYRVDDKE